ncbi:methyltransferase, partial [mine drainage metagenome]
GREEIGVLLYCVEFSGESNSAVQAELRSVKDVTPEIRILWINSRGAVIDGNLPILKEMAFARRISEVLLSGESIKDFDGFILPPGNFYLRKVRLEDPPIDYSESELADAVGARGRVSFSNPDFVVLAMYADKWYISVVRHTRESKAMESRRAPMRPFFSPISLHPKFARFMVNLSRT